MNKADTAPTGKDENRIRTQLQQVLTHPLFAQAGRQVRFLDYIVKATLDGNGNKLNQYLIGIDVFDRDTAFDPAVDSIVRVEAGRLRAKLREYNTGPGAADPVLFELPKGRYSVNFIYPGLIETRPDSQGVRTDDRPVIAVLPFINSSTDTETDYFADGITEDLITDLSRLSALDVIARNSTFKYKSDDQDLKMVADELGADYLLLGSVRKSGSRVRITARLHQVATGNSTWAERYDRELTDIFAVQDDVTRMIISRLQLSLSSPEQLRIGVRGTDNMEAYDCVLRGVECINESIQNNREQAGRLFRRAIDLDRQYAEPHARLAAIYVYEWIVGISDRVILDKALLMANRAVELDEKSAFAHTSLGWVYQWLENFDKAITAWDRAVKLDPNHVRALDLLALNLAWKGDIDTARQTLDRARQLNPVEPYFFVEGMLAFMDDDFDSAIRYFSKRLEIDAAFVPAHIFLAASYEITGEHAAGSEQAATVMQLSPDYRVPESNSNTIRVPEKARQFREALLALGLPGN